jgi:hypothetical protein
VCSSRWFVLGSILFVITSVIILDNSIDNNYLGTDDSVLPTASYRWSWILTIICGVFCTLGRV